MHSATSEVLRRKLQHHSKTQHFSECIQPRVKYREERCNITAQIFIPCNSNFYILSVNSVVFLLRCILCKAVLAMAEMSACPSVCQTSEWWCKNFCQNSYAILPYKRYIHLFLWHEEWLVEDDLLYLKFWAKLTPFLQKRQFSIDFRSRCLSHDNSYWQCSITTNSKSTTSFPMSLRWSVYVAPKQ